MISTNFAIQGIYYYRVFIMTSFLGLISNFILVIIGKIGYLGIFFLMFLQSFNIPIPSEVTMPFSGFLASRGILNFWLVVVFGVLGNVFGAFLSYKLAGVFLNKKIREKIWLLKFLISDRNLAMAQNWFNKYGMLSVFLGRIVPVLSTFISFPAGLAKMDLKKFIPLTFGGALIWNYFLTKIGFVLGENWSSVSKYFRQFDYVIVGTIVVIGVVWLLHRLRNTK